MLVGPVLALTVAACSVSVSTAHFGSLQIGGEKDFTTETTTFGPQDTVYAHAEAANLPNAVTVKWQVVAVNVTGQQPNTPIPAFDMSLNVASDAVASVTLTPPSAGWPAGTYKIVVTMMDGDTQRDQKSEQFTVTGAAPASAEPASS
jgi:hypothetical protein